MIKLRFHFQKLYYTIKYQLINISQSLALLFNIAETGY